MVQGSLDFGGQRFVWSDLQRAIFEAVEDSDGGNLAVKARAGCAKTSSICEAVRHIPRRAKTLCVAFNKDIRDELARRLPLHVDVLTTHSLGLRALRKSHPHSLHRVDRVRDLLRGEGFFPGPKAGPWRSAAGRLIDRAKATLAQGPADLDALIDDCGIVLEDLVPKERRPGRGGLSDEQSADLRAQLVDAVGRALLLCGEHPEEHDFSDMLWLPVVHGLPVGAWNWIVVDECQDLSRVQLELIASALAPGGRVLVVGDPAQAIYKFRGADSAAFDRLVARFGCRVLPLSVTYRCPRRVVALAQRIVPDFEAGPSAPEGIVREVEDLPVAELAPGDFVLSRKNAPLVRHAIRALAAGKPAAIAGRDLAKDLGLILRGAIDRQGDDRRRVIPWLVETYRERIRGLLARELDPAHLEDELSCLLALLDAQPTVSEAAALLDRLCAEKPGSVVTFSSVHRAKGLERERVYVLASTFRCPEIFGAHAAPIWRGDAVEESCLAYVAITRTKRELVIVTSEH